MRTNNNIDFTWLGRRSILANIDKSFRTYGNQDFCVKYAYDV